MNRQPGNQQPVETPDSETEHEEHHRADEAEEVRTGSQTAQDRDHTIRGGDNRTGPMKEFPT